MWLLAKRTQGKGRKGGGVGGAITLGGRLFWTGFGCSGFFVSPPANASHPGYHHHYFLKTCNMFLDF